ncbi:glycosyltransferase family 39 protein [Thiomicrorhabdus cannonii]|uniref:glycosyltransferase family 39 protein n=1 Tax=Thiomicrorhabdus cannonii TaxID=2748011 RepID=UPI0015C05DB4
MIARLSELTLLQKRLLGVFVLLKLALLFWLPLTGDEAYFITWGQSLALGYYDHPPAVGWVLGLMSLVADNLYWYRSFAFVASILLAYWLYQLLLMRSSADADDAVRQTALWVALAFFVSPVSLMFVLTANDTVLVFFGVWGVYLFAKAMQTDSWLWTVLAGVVLGMAFLSKYFAAFMLLGLLAFALWQWRNWRKIAVMAAIILLFVGENLYFNLTHCWNNILFNFVSRTRDSHLDLMQTASFIAMVLAMLSPLGVYYWSRARQSLRDERILQLAWFAALPLLGVLFIVSLSNPVGLHWPLLSVVLLHLLYAKLSLPQLHRLYAFNALVSGLIALVVLAALPFAGQLVDERERPLVPLYTDTAEVCRQLPQGTLFTLDYSSQSTLAYHCQNDDIHVFKSLSKYGREDDKLVDFKALDGQTLTLLVIRERELQRIKPYFDEVDIEPLKPVRGAVYWRVTGKGFNYALYREKVLREIYENFYHQPDWLPPAKCGFKERYGF